MAKNLIPGYPAGSDLTILDARYHYPKKNEETGKWSKDSITIIYRDNKTGEKKHYDIIEPEYTYYVLKDGFDPGYNLFFTEEKNVRPITCKYKDLSKSLAEQLGCLDYYYDCIKSGNKENVRLLTTDYRILESDIGINNFYRMKFKRTYTDEYIQPTRAFLDIEADTRYMAGDFPEMGECPINAVSYLEYESKELTTVLYDDGKNPLIKEFAKSLNQKAFNQEFKELLKYALGGENKVKSFGLENIKTRVAIYHDELSMLIDLFKYINARRYDFVLAWNMGFDVPYIIARLKNLGVDPRDVICDPDFKIKECNYFIDEMHYDIHAQRGDFADISAYPIYLDQLIQFASRRKGQSVYQSMKLDDIGYEVAGVRKLDYSDITTNISDLPYLDYRTFVKYNMMDVIVQYCIENKTNDISYVFNKALQNCTEYRKVHRQTIYLANRAVMCFYDYGHYICGNNVNKFKSGPRFKYEGAFVSNPTLVSNKVKDKIGNTPINRARNAIDFDFKALYPSIAREYNLAPNTQIGFINIPEQVYENENIVHNDKYTRSGAYIEDLTSDNYIEFCHRWFHLANFKELYEDIMEYFSNNELPFYDIEYDIVKHKYLPVTVINKNTLINVVTTMPKPNAVKYQTLSKSQKDNLLKLFGGNK